jgi:hypothetical protein
MRQSRENASRLEMSSEETRRLKGQHDQYGELSLREPIENYITHTAKHPD